MSLTRLSALLGLSFLGLIPLQIHSAIAGDIPSASQTRSFERKNLDCRTRNLLSTPEKFDCVFNAYTPLIERASSPGNQINLLIGFSNGRIYESYMFPDRASLFDSIEIRNLYRDVMRRQSEDSPYMSREIPSPFDTNNNNYVDDKQ